MARDRPYSIEFKREVAQELLGGRTVTILDTLTITELIARAPWREAVTYRNTWPHEYVLSRKDGQRELIEAVRARFRAGEGVAGSFFGRRNTYLFIGDHKYWLMTHWDAVDLDDEQDYVLNRARLYRDRRDFVVQSGDSGRFEDDPASPAHQVGSRVISVYARRRLETRLGDRNGRLGR